MEIIEKRIEERKRIIRNAQEYSLTFEFKATVILIGSYARGDFNLWSDVDIMIIGDFTGNLCIDLRILIFRQDMK